MLLGTYGVRATVKFVAIKCQHYSQSLLVVTYAGKQFYDMNMCLPVLHA